MYSISIVIVLLLAIQTIESTIDPDEKEVMLQGSPGRPIMQQPPPSKGFNKQIMC